MTSPSYLLACAYVAALWRKDFFLNLLRSNLVRLHLRLLGVEHGEGTRVHGMAVISSRPGSRMRVGSICRFRSSSRGNAIGVNHAAVVRTLSPGAQLCIGDKFWDERRRNLRPWTCQRWR